MTEYEEFQRFLSLQSSEVKSNVEEVTPESLGQEFFLHIATDPPKYFIPRMPYAAGMKENVTTPRITVSDHLLGCMNGYARVLTDFQNPKHPHTYKINMFLFRYALRPSIKLVPDADVTDECWLVTYNDATRRYRAIEIGEMKSVSMEMSHCKDGHSYGTVEILIALYGDHEIRLTPTDVVGEGFYRFITYIKAGVNSKGIEYLVLHPSACKVETISKSVYMAGGLKPKVPPAIIRNKSTQW
jgi:hypothetical protein